MKVNKSFSLDDESMRILGRVKGGKTSFFVRNAIKASTTPLHTRHYMYTSLTNKDITRDDLLKYEIDIKGLLVDIQGLKKMERFQ